MSIINLTNYVSNFNYYLNNFSYIKFDILPDNILNYSKYNYKKLYNLIKTPNKSSVMVFNKNYTNPQLYEERCERWFKSYLNTPKFIKNSNKSYMFSGKNLIEIEENLPNLFKPYYYYMKKLNNNYNQVVVNYYETEKDNIPYHRDWTLNMIKNYEISIITLNENIKNKRIFQIKNINNNNIYNIELKNGLIIIMGGNFQNDFRHRVLKLSNNNNINRRLSLTFRQFI